MGKFLKTFWTSAVSLAGLIGLYLAAVQAKLMWAFWVVIPFAIICGVVAVFGRKALAWLERIRDYPQLSNQVNELKSAVHDLTQANATLLAAQGAAWSEGLDEGMARVWGAVLSRNTTPPTLVAITEYDGSVALVAKLPETEAPEYGARFIVQSVRTGVLKGVVELCEADGFESQTAYLRVIEPTSARFWESLADRVAYDDSLPDGIKLRAYDIATDRLLTERPAAAFIGGVDALEAEV